MLSVHRISIPTPYPVGPVNAYLIKGDPLTMVDCGPDTPEAREVLTAGLKEQGVSPEDIKRIVLTHAHPDHSGMAQWLWKESGAEVYVHPYEYRKITGEQDFIKERLPFIVKMGIPMNILLEMAGDRDKVPRPTLSGVNTVAVTGGEKLRFDGREMDIMHLPGHATGHICLYDSREGELFSGDFLLLDITPNPLLEADPENPERRYPSLSRYLECLELVDGLGIKRALPGHGGIIEDPGAVIASSREHHQRRFDRLLEILGDNGKMNTYNISSTMYPDLRGFHIFLGLSEVQAHLDVLLEQGCIKVEYSQGVAFYLKAPGE
ncbi:MBL fold metallo-hydrolase [Desulfocucumis palustris]|nr:MBL fold metallo-hydrolase [Desulfocucumis palustris]